MSKISGKDGKVFFNTSTEIKVTQWDIKQAIGTKDVSDSSSTGGKDYLPDALYDIDGTFEGFAIQAMTLPTFGSAVTLDLKHDSTGKWSGSAIITNMGEALQVSGGNAVKCNWAFKGTGAWTRTSP